MDSYIYRYTRSMNRISAVPRRQRSPTLEDVADRAGVSRMTVSNVVNGAAARVGAKTRAAVLRTIRELGYVPNSAARKLASGAEQRIAFLMFADANPMHSDAITAALHVCAKRSVQLTVVDIEGEPFALTRNLAATGISAVLVPSLHCASEEFMRYLSDQGLAPVGLLPGTRPIPGFSCVWIDDRGAAYDATALLISLGHRRIGHVRGPLQQPSARERYDGFRFAMRDAGLPISEDRIAQGDFSFRSGLSAADALLNSRERPTAIFAANDDMAAGVLSAAYRHHLQVPEQLSVFGFDDTMLATRLAPELSTVRQPLDEVLDAAVDLALIAARELRATGRIEPVHKEVRYRIIQRETTASLLQR